MKQAVGEIPVVQQATKKKRPLAGSSRSLVFLVVFFLLFALFVVPMGLANTLNTLMNTAYRLLVDTTLYIMAIAVLAGAISALLSEFGVIELLNRLLSPLMKPLFGMPGAAALGIVTTYLSDNPAILTLADDQQYRRYFKAYQIPALTNLGTAFGMGLIVTTFMLGLGDSAGPHIALAALCGNLGAVIGSILSTRLMLRSTAKVMGREAPAGMPAETAPRTAAGTAESSGGMRVMSALMEGGRKGVELGLGIIPGVLVICTLVMMLTNGAPADGVYTGGAYEGIALLPAIADKLDFLRKPLFGFSSRAGNRPGLRRSSLGRGAHTGPERPGQLQRYRRFYGHVYVLERISQHPCVHDGCTWLHPFHRQGPFVSHPGRPAGRRGGPLALRAVSTVSLGNAPWPAPLLGSASLFCPTIGRIGISLDTRRFMAYS